MLRPGFLNRGMSILLLEFLAFCVLFVSFEVGFAVDRSYMYWLVLLLALFLSIFDDFVLSGLGLDAMVLCLLGSGTLGVKGVGRLGLGAVV